MDTSRLEEVLSEFDQARVLDQREKFVVGMRTLEVIPTLSKQKGYFSQQQLGALNQCKKSEDKAKFLVTTVISKGTYRHLEVFINALLDTGHEMLADSLSAIMMERYKHNHLEPNETQNHSKINPGTRNFEIAKSRNHASTNPSEGPNMYYQYQKQVKERSANVHRSTSSAEQASYGNGNSAQPNLDRRRSLRSNTSSVFTKEAVDHLCFAGAFAAQDKTTEQSKNQATMDDTAQVKCKNRNDIQNNPNMNDCSWRSLPNASNQIAGSAYVTKAIHNQERSNKQKQFIIKMDQTTRYGSCKGSEASGVMISTENMSRNRSKDRVGAASKSTEQGMTLSYRSPQSNQEKPINDMRGGKTPDSLSKTEFYNTDVQPHMNQKRSDLRQEAVPQVAGQNRNKHGPECGVKPKIKDIVKNSSDSQQNQNLEKCDLSHGQTKEVKQQARDFGTSEGVQHPKPSDRKIVLTSDKTDQTKVKNYTGRTSGSRTGKLLQSNEYPKATNPYDIRANPERMTSNLVYTRPTEAHQTRHETLDTDRNDKYQNQISHKTAPMVKFSPGGAPQNQDSARKHLRDCSASGSQETTFVPSQTGACATNRGESVSHQEVGEEFVQVTRPKTGCNMRTSYSLQSHIQRCTERRCSQELSSEVFQMIDDKKCLCHNFFKVLKKLRDGAPETWCETKTAEGLNILHVIAQKGRCDLLHAVVQIGWWRVLSRMQVDDTSSSQYQGLTAKEIADREGNRSVVEKCGLMDTWEQSLSPLMKAVRCNDRPHINTLIAQPNMIHHIDQNNSNACYWAVIHGYFRLLEELIGKGIDVKMKTSKNENLLHLACMMDCQDMLQPLYQVHDMDPWAEDSFGMAPIDRLAQNGNIAAMEVLRECGVMPQGSTMTTSALWGQKAFLVHLVEEWHTDVNIRNKEGYTALHMACQADRVDIVTYLIDKGADVNICSVNGENLLHIIARHGSKKTLEYLVSVHRECWPLLNDMINVQNRYNGEELCAVTELPRQTRVDRNQWCLLEVARHKCKVFKRKQERGEAIKPTDFGETIQTGRGLRPSKEDWQKIHKDYSIKRLQGRQPPDMTPLHVAIFNGQSEIAMCFIENNANLSIGDKFDLTPLLLAVSCGLKNVVTLLLSKKVDSKAVCQSGETCLQIAEMNEEDQSMIEIIQEYNDFINIQDVKEELENIEQGLAVNSLDRADFQRRNKERNNEAWKSIHTISLKALRENGYGPFMQEAEALQHEIRRRGTFQTF